MANINKSNTPKSEKDYWRSSKELINDSLKLLNIPYFDVDVCAIDGETKIDKAISYISEKQNALSPDCCWFDVYENEYQSFCNPPFSLKWQFFQKAIEQVRKWNQGVLMVLPYTPCTKEWADNVHGTDCIIYLPDGRYQYLLPDGSKPKNSCNFETCLILIVPFKCGNVTINYKRGLNNG